MRSMSERIRGSYDDALYKSTHTLLYLRGGEQGREGKGGLEMKYAKGRNRQAGGRKGDGRVCLCTITELLLK